MRFYLFHVPKQYLVEFFKETEGVSGNSKAFTQAAFVGYFDILKNPFKQVLKGFLLLILRGYCFAGHNTKMGELQNGSSFFILFDYQ